MKQLEMHSIENMLDTNPHAIPVEAPMSKSAMAQAPHKPGNPLDAQGYGMPTFG